MQSLIRRRSLGAGLFWCWLAAVALTVMTALPVVGAPVGAALAAEGPPPPGPGPGPGPADGGAPDDHGLKAVSAHVTTIAGKVIDGDLTAADATSLTFETTHGTVQIPLADAIQVDFDTETKLRPSGMQVLFLDGSSLDVDAIPGATEDKLKVKTTTVGGDLSLPVDHVLGVIFDVNAKRLAEYREAILTRQTEHDFVLLPNVDSISGTMQFAKWKDRDVTIDVAGEKREFKDTDAAGVKLQVLADKAVPPPLHVVVTLIDGSQLTGTTDSVADGKLVLSVQTAKIPLITGAIRSLQVVGSRMKYLSDLEPTAKDEYPLLKNLPTAFPMHRDHTCTGKPIMLNNKLYAHGIGVHAYSHLTYDLNEGYEKFYSLVGIDDNMVTPGQVLYTVLVDGQARKTGELASKKAEPIEVDVKGAHKLELIVDFASDSDRGDSVVWAGARLIQVGKD
ncbi:MAG: NPCBM/NEW2 domain-containing protein [Planctomycetota bacterium]